MTVNGKCIYNIYVGEHSGFVYRPIVKFFQTGLDISKFNLK